MDISVIYVSYNTKEITRESLKRLLASDHDLKMEIIVVDNASRDDSVAMLKAEFPEIPLIENKVNVGFGRANNQALPLIHGRYVLLLNTDAYVAPDTIAKTVAYMDAHPECGILGAKLIGEDGSLQPSCRYFPTPWKQFLHVTGLYRHFGQVRMVDDMDWDHDSARNCDWVPGCYYLIRKEVIDRVGLFDPRYFMYCEEVDHCFATKKAGWQVTYFPEPVVHLGGQSAKSDGKLSTGRQLKPLQIESELLYFRKNYGLAYVLLNVFLTTLADMIRLTKDFLKLKDPNGYFLHFRHSLLLWGLFFKTKMGAQPTR